MVRRYTFTKDTQPAFMLLSIIHASISTVPSRVKTEPYPALKLSSNSIDFTASSTASKTEPPLIKIV